MNADKRLVAIGFAVFALAACGPTADPIIVATGVPGGAAPTATAAPSPSGGGAGQLAEFPGEVIVPDEGQAHVEVGTEIAYQHYPPASGPHYPVTLEYGLYETDVPEGYWIHSLEHGAIVVLYKCDQPCPDLVQALGNLLDSFPLSKWNNRKIVIVPYPSMDAPLMAAAWNVQMPMAQFNPQALIDFYARHIDRGPEDVP